MAEQQLIDYITKAKTAGQSDDQTKNLLYKNGWTEAEVLEAFTSLVKPEVKLETQAKQAEDKVVADTIKAIDQLDVKPVVEQKPEPEIKPQEPKQPVVEAQPLIVDKPQPEIQVRPQPDIQSEKFEAKRAVASMPSDMPIIRKKSHAILKTLIVLIILVVLGGAGYMFAGQYINLWNPFAQSPEQVIGKMLSNMATVKSYHSVANINISSTNGDSKSSQGKLTINVAGDTDITNVANKKGSGNVKVNLAVPGSDSAILSLNMDTVLIGATSYLKISNIVLPAGVSYPGLSISQIDGKWFLIDENTYKTLSQAETGTVTTTVATPTDSLALAKKVQDLIVSEKIFADAKKINDEVVGGQSTLHYSVKISKEKIKSLINKIMDLSLQEASKLETKDASASTIEDIAKSVVASAVDSIGDINIEMWIGKKDYMLYQYKFDKAIDLSKVLGAATSLNVNAVGNNSNFNVPVVVAVPEGAQKIEEVVLPLVKIGKINSKLSQINFDAQTLFTNVGGYYALCNRGLVNGYLANYGTDLVAMHTDIVNLGAGKPACYSAGKSYCVSTQLVDGTYLCVDATGNTGTTKCVSAQTICK